MGEVRENVTLTRARDRANFIDGLIKEDEIHQTVVNAVADTGAWTLIITEDTCKKLELSIIDKDKATVAGGDKKDCWTAEAVEVHWKDRFSTLNPRVLPGESDNLLGALPLEDMDLMVDPVNRRLAGVHGDTWVKYVR